MTIKDITKASTYTGTSLSQALFYEDGYVVTRVHSLENFQKENGKDALAWLTGIFVYTPTKESPVRVNRLPIFAKSPTQIYKFSFVPTLGPKKFSGEEIFTFADAFVSEEFKCDIIVYKENLTATSDDMSLALKVTDTKFDHRDIVMHGPSYELEEMLNVAVKEVPARQYDLNEYGFTVTTGKKYIFKPNAGEAEAFAKKAAESIYKGDA